MNTFFFEFFEWVIKNPYFYTDFRNVDLTLVDSAAKNQFEGTMNSSLSKMQETDQY